MTIEATSGRAGGARPVMKVWVQGENCDTLFDTGADVSALASQKFLRLRKRPKLNPTQVTLRSANGSKMAVLGQARMVVQAGPKRVMHRFMVVDGMKSDCILGADFMAKHRVVVDVGEKKVFLQQPSQRLVVRTTRNTTIPPRSEALVQARAEDGRSGEWVFESIEASSTPGLVQMNDGRCTVQMQNLTEVPQRVERGQIIGHLVESGDSIEVGQEVELASLESREPSENRKQIKEEDVNLDGVPKTYRGAFLDLLNKYSDVMSWSSKDVGFTKAVEQKIVLKDPSKIACIPPYRIPQNLLSVAHEYVADLQQAGIIQKSTSPFNSPLMLVRKPGATAQQPLIEQYRVVHDYRRLNANTVRDSYPMRNLYDLLDSVAGAQIWSVIDLSSGFWNQNLAAHSRPYTAFGLPGVGHWEYTRSAQGLCNSPASFQRLLDYVTQGVAKAHVYVDDIIICSETMEEHLQVMETIYSRFRKYNLKCRLSKLQLGAAKVKYLGYTITRGVGIQAGEAKIEAVRKWAEPTSVTEVKQFLGLCSFFRRTVKDFAVIAGPLTRLTRKDSGWTSGPLPMAAKAAFQALQRALCSRPCLQPVTFEREFIVTVDASSRGLGAILSQRSEAGVEHPCAYASRSLNAVEQGWAPTRLEHMAMVWACRYFRPYLAGKHFTMRTDHKPLVALNRIDGQVMERLRSELEEYQPFTVEYCKGEKMPADGLSRICEVNASASMPTAITTDQLYHLQREDGAIKALACYLKFGQMPNKQHWRQLISEVKDKAKIKNGVVTIHTRHGHYAAMTPSSLKELLLYQAHDAPTAGHRSAKVTLDKLTDHWYWPGMQEDVDVHCRGCRVCTAVNQPAHMKPAPLRPLTPPTFFNQRVHVDLLGPLPLDRGCKYLLVMQDAYSRLVELAPLANKTAEITAQAILDGWICSHGSPVSLVSDQGKEFVNSVMHEMCKSLHITHQLASVMHPQSNGLVERTNRNVITYFRKYLEGSNDWLDSLAPMKLSFNTSWHASIKQTPFMRAFGRKPVLPLSLADVREPESRYSETRLLQQIREHHIARHRAKLVYEQSFREQKQQFDKRSEVKKFLAGDIVYVTRPHTGTQFQKFQKPFMGPYEVLYARSRDNYTLQAETGKQINVHSNRIKSAPFVQQLYQIPRPLSEADTTTTHIRTPRAVRSTRTKTGPSSFDDDDAPPPLAGDGDRGREDDVEEGEPEPIEPVQAPDDDAVVTPEPQPPQAKVDDKPRAPAQPDTGEPKRGRGRPPKTGLSRPASTEPRAPAAAATGTLAKRGKAIGPSRPKTADSSSSSHSSLDTRSSKSTKSGQVSLPGELAKAVGRLTRQQAKDQKVQVADDPLPARALEHKTKKKK